MFKKVLLLSVLTLAGPLSIHSVRADGAPSTDPQEDLCLQKATSNLDISACASESRERAEASIQVAITALKKDFGQTPGADSLEETKRLDTSQAAWEKYRDAECILEGAEMLGGSGEAVTEAQCEADLSRARATQLQQLVAAFTGGQD
jgi:uncharacterized protein YecT (DUF1311 family)